MTSNGASGAAKRLQRAILPAVMTFALAACSAMPARTDFGEQAGRDAAAVDAWSGPSGATPPAYLNRLVASDELNALLQESLQANAGLQKSLLTLRMRQAQHRSARGAQLPSVEANLGGERGEEAGNSFGGSVSVSWTLDLWARLADESAAAGKDVAEQQALYQSARDTLAAEVMTNWLNLIGQQRGVDIQTQRVNSLARNEQFIVQRYRNGLGSLEDLDSAKTSTASARATLAQMRDTLAQLQQSLRSLLGRTDASVLKVTAGYPAVDLAIADLPEQTLQRRPDLQAAFRAIEAADLRTSVAYKALLPSLSLTAALQDSASSSSALFLADPVWSLLAQLTAPIYQGGQLRAAAEVAALETAYAYQAYREALINAVTEVTTALGREKALAEQLDHTQTALDSARRNLDQYQRSYRSGLVDIIDLLTVQRQTYDLEDQLNSLQYERLGNRIALGLALGLGVEPEISGVNVQ